MTKCNTCGRRVYWNKEEKRWWHRPSQLDIKCAKPMYIHEHKHPPEYEGSILNVLDGLKGEVGDLKRRAITARKNSIEMRKKIMMYKASAAREETLHLLMKKTNPKLYYEMVQIAFPDAKRIPDQYKIKK